jgi:TonB family protein
MLHTQLLIVLARLPSQLKENVPMNFAVFCAFVVIAVVSLIGIRRGDLGAPFSSIRKVLPVLAIACLAFTVSSIHAQDKVRNAVHKVAPVYPPVARQMQLGGTVVVNVTVDPSGKVIKAESSSPFKVFIPSAVAAVKQWKFAPGDATDTFSITVNFEKIGGN